jgi:hypothetical protein
MPTTSIRMEIGLRLLILIEAFHELQVPPAMLRGGNPHRGFAGTVSAFLSKIKEEHDNGYLGSMSLSRSF